MKGKGILVSVISCIVVLVAIGAGNRQSLEAPSTVSSNAPAPGQSRQGNSVNSPQVVELPSVEVEASNTMRASVAPLFNLDWYSVNGGGETEVTSASYGLGVSVGQSVSGHVTGTDYQLGLGFWYGAGGGGGGVCLVALTGDVNLASGVNTTDIIYLVNFVLKGGPLPLPCEANGDANCTGEVNTTDIIVLVNYVLKGGPPPCDVCALIPGTWSCP